MLVIRGGASRLLWEEVVHFPRFRLEHPSKARSLRVETDEVILQALGRSLSRLQTRPELVELVLFFTFDWSNFMLCFVNNDITW